MTGAASARRFLDRHLLRAVAVAEALTALALMVWPVGVIRLLFAKELEHPAGIPARVAGMALLGLSIACLPRGARRPAHAAMLVYGALVAICFVVIGVEGRQVGVLLWPAAFAHAVLTPLLAWVFWRQSPAPFSPPRLD